MTGTQALRLNNIQILRFIAAFAVVMSHWQPDPSGIFLHVFPFRSGVFGVDVFFVISEFVMAHSTISKNVSPASFMKRRIWRIVPLYWLLTLAVFCVAIVAPGVVGATSGSLVELLKSLFFIPFVKASGLIQPTLFVGWTLNYEMFFYLCFALALFLPRPILVLSTGFVLLVALGLAFPSENTLWRFYSDPRVLEFSFGVWLRLLLPGLLGLRHLVAPAALWLALAVLAVAAGWVVHDHMGEAWIIIVTLPVAAAIVAVSLMLPEGGSALYRGFVTLGDASYACYLAHFFVLKAVLVVMPVEGVFARLALTALAFGLVTVVSLMLFRLVERPSMRFLKSRFGG